MRKPITLLASVGIAAVLAGCNSMDDLTPQVDVGGGTFRSPPVNQSDLDAMSQQTVTPQATTPVQSTQLASPVEEGFADGPRGTLMAQGDGEYTDPAGSLDAQAGRLQQGQVPAQQRITRRAVIAESTDTASVDEPAPAEQQQSAEPRRAEEETPPIEKPQKAAAIAPAATAGTIRFLPIIGAPVEAVTPLSKQLGAEARSHGLTIKSASDTSSQHILKGYFSALKDGGKITVVYVWDILDGSGNRLHRIQGQDTVDATATDLWSAVPAQTMQTIATKTIAGYLDWRAENAG
ncbi:hypothetical protein OIU34_05220 [Pararhizobium sp. BT-229]|uniref:hypothetical protein n=1 Tax=Pararhizobium sp. BT-229 TaxID=2986923 RepID=UPI0021F7EAA1|nr:hypothetical protein [Pararhizobium sp. BT-229]MCV9961294.1 hypothetical protein [Pararhizobium sp. BT-229]